VKVMFEWDLAGAERLYARAIELDPNYAWAHHWLGLTVLMGAGRFDEALVSVRRAADLDPLTQMINMAVGIVLHYSRRFDEALRVYRNLLDAEPNHGVLHFYTGLTYEQLGRFDDAIRHFERAEEIGGRPTMFVASRAHALGAAGRDEAAAVAASVEAILAERHVSGYSRAIATLGTSDIEGTLKMLEIAFEERSPWLMLMSIDPRMDPIRAHPRVLELAQQHKLEI